MPDILPPRQTEQATLPVERIGFWRSLTKKEKIAAIACLIVFLCVFYITLDANKYRATVRVIEGDSKVGINPTTERLDFGDLSKGTSAIRRIDLENNSPFSTKVIIVDMGGISELMKTANHMFTLRSGEKKQMNFEVYIPASAEINKTYSGRVFIFRIPFL